MVPYEVWRTRSGVPVALFGVEPQDDGMVLALGIHAPQPLRAGRILTAPGKAAYRLAQAAPAGLRLVGGPPGHTLDAPLALTPRRRP